jgi:hypothetical protein
MTLSEKRVLEILESNTSEIEDLGFILTVIKDNTSDDKTFKFLSLLLKKLK